MYPNNYVVWWKLKKKTERPKPIFADNTFSLNRTGPFRVRKKTPKKHVVRC